MSRLRLRSANFLFIFVRFIYYTYLIVENGCAKFINNLLTTDALAKSEKREYAKYLHPARRKTSGYLPKIIVQRKIEIRNIYPANFLSI